MNEYNGVWTYSNEGSCEGEFVNEEDKEFICGQMDKNMKGSERKMDKEGEFVNGKR